MKYNRYIFNILFSFVLLQTTYSKEISRINLRISLETGIMKTSFENQYPDSAGLLRVFKVELPNYVKGIYSAQDTFYDYWQVNGNRVLPWFFKPDTFADLFIQPAYGVDDEKNLSFKNVGFKGKTRYVSRYGCFIQLMLSDGRFLSILPLAGPKALAWFHVNTGGDLELQVANYGTEPVSEECPILAWAVGDNINESSYRLFDTIKTDKAYAQTLRLRYEKNFPEMFEYLGWCTWEEYKKNISADLLLKELERLKQVPLPIRYAIVDDGHLAFKTSGVEVSKGILSSFSPNEKFPEGFAPLLAMREPEGLRWMGLWHNFNGYWGGFSRENDFGTEVNDCLRIIEKTGYVMSKIDTMSIRRVYEAFLGRSASDGFDFLKVDWQAANLYMQRYSENAAEGAFNTSRTVDDIAHKYFSDAVINCMAMNNIALQNTYHVNITRTSIDYKLNNLFMAKEHLLQSYHNALYICPTVWGDHDMFHSSDQICGKIMALSKALSGGPVYLSDASDSISSSMVWPLCFGDGKLIRPLAPATVLQRSAFNSPLITKEPYFVSAPLDNGAVAIIAYNLMVDSCTVEGVICPDDYAMTGTLIQPYEGKWKLPEEGLYLYDYESGTGELLNEEYAFRIKGFDDKFFLLLPVNQGWAVIGRVDKYLSPATVKVVRCLPETLILSMSESGAFDFWMKEGEPVSESTTFAQLGKGLWRATPMADGRDQTIIINRK